MPDANQRKQDGAAERRTLRFATLILLVLVLGGVRPQSAQAQGESSALRIGLSGSTFFYTVPYTDVNGQVYSTELPFQQSTPDIGVETPKNYFGNWYFNAGVNFHVLNQLEQGICDPSDAANCTPTAVPEPTYLFIREFTATLGYGRNIFFFETSLGYVESLGTYYHDGQRYEIDDSYPLIRLKGILEGGLSKSFRFGASLGGAATPQTAGGSGLIIVETAVFLKISM